MREGKERSWWYWRWERRVREGEDERRERRGKRERGKEGGKDKREKVSTKLSY